MAEGVSGIVSSTAYIATDEADPQIGIRAADAAFIETNLFSQVCAVEHPFPKTEIILGVAAYGTAGSAPLLKTGAVEDMLAKDREETRGFVHTLEADGASRQLDQGWSGWSVRF